jgi:anaerobic magnesium-protoporphyrin IX monomethyl ester cyclase
MRVLLSTLNAKYIHMNLAIRLLYKLNENYNGLAWKEFTIKENKDEIANYCSQYNIVAFSCYIWNITPTLDVCRKIKSINPDVKILLGGPEVSYDYESIINKNEVDYIIVGEGEIAFKDFLAAYPIIESVPGLVWKNNGNVIANPLPKQFNLQEFNDINPYENDKSEELYNKVCYIETSRGCPYKCEFCLASLDNKVRYLPNERIKANLLYLMQHARVIKFLDRTFNIKKDFTIDIFKFILENHRPENVFQFEITADIVHPEIIQFIQQHVPKGLFRFEIGIQTVNQKANLEVSRKQNFEKTKNVILQLRDKIEMHLDLIVGLPLDYFEDIKYSFEEVFKLFPPELQLGFLKFLKGTPVREKYPEHGFLFDSEPPYQIIESNYLSKEQLHKITQLEHALEIYWNKKRALNALKYVTQHYSIFDFLLELGIYFGERKTYYKYTLDDVYLILSAFAKEKYADDIYLQELIAIDYYLHFKVKPKNLIINEIERNEKTNIIDAMALNHHKYRFVMLDIHFDFEHFSLTNSIKKQASIIILQYDGTSKAKVVGKAISGAGSYL